MKLQPLLSYGAHIGLPTFNLPPGLPCNNGTCVGATEWCAGFDALLDPDGVDPTDLEQAHGYCHHGRWNCPSTVAALARRLEWARDLPRFERRLRAEAELWADAGAPAIRLLSSGEFYSPEFLEVCASVADDSPIPFLGFSKSWRRALADVPDGPAWAAAWEGVRHARNFYLWASTDPSVNNPIGYWPRVAVVLDNDHRDLCNCPKLLTRGTIKCDTCRKCFSTRGGVVYFWEHY